MNTKPQWVQQLELQQNHVSKLCLDKASLSFIRVDSNGHILYANPHACKIYGYTLEEFVTISLFDIDPAITRDIWPNLWQNICEKSVLVFEGVNIRKDGTVFPVEVDVYLLEADGQKTTGAFMRDISDRKMVEEAAQLTQFIYDKVSVAILHGREDGKILNANEQACKFYGYTKNELCNLTIFDIEACQSEVQIMKKWDKTHEENVLTFETEHKHKDGTILPVEVTANSLVHEGTKYSITFVKDISAKKQEEMQKAKVNEHLQHVQRLDSLGTLAGGIAHDFNNILSAIFGYTELTKLSCLDNEKVQHYLDQLHSASLRAKNLVQQILNFSRQSGSEMHPIDISRVVNEALNLIRATVPTTIEISKNVPSDLGVVIANETQLHQIVMNLCTNAYHAIKEESGSIDVDLITTTISAKDGINYPDLDPGEYLKLIITDTGSGIPAEIMPNIFDPYFTTKVPGEGTGLGLSTVHGIVKNHGGSIRVYSEQNRGTSFQIFLPIVESRPEETDYSAEHLPHGTETILFVDDERLLLEIGKELLESLGYRVETRASSIDAFEAFRVNPAKYNLIVSDMTMPKMSGEQLAVKIKAIKPNAPIILCTGFSTRLNSEKLMKIGIAKVLMKPVTINELAVNVRLALDNI
jgi:PAS domain S-box-containing protein